MQYYMLLILCVVITALNTSTGETANQCPNEDEIQKHDISIFLYYVSWAQQNHSVLKIYEKIAQDYGSFMYFISKDCSHTNCNCSRIYQNQRGNHNTMNRWPVLEIYHAQDHMLRYTGQWNYASLARFMEVLIQPVVRIREKNHLHAIGLRHDAIILAHFPNISNYRKQYIQFIVSAYQFLEYDPLQSFKFAITTGKEFQHMFEYEIKWPQIFFLTTHNDGKTLETFSSGRGDKKVNTWKLHKIIHWLHLNWLKMHTKLYDYNSPSKLATQLRTTPVLAMVIGDNFLGEFKNMQNLNYLNKTELFGQCIGASRTVLKNKCTKLCARQVFSNSNLDQENYFSFLNERCSSFKLSSQNLFILKSRRLTTLWNKCISDHYMSTELRISLTKYIKMHIDKILSNQKNKTLSIVLLDAAAYTDYLKEHIHLPAISTTSAFIADNQTESVYILQKPYTFENLLQFIQDYLDNNLPVQPLETKNNEIVIDDSYIQFVHNVNRSTFMNILERDDSTIILFQYTKNCVFCNIMFQSVQQISAILNSNQDLNSTRLSFISIDMHSQTLHWQLNVHNTPTLMVFPRRKYSESRIFPSNLPMDVRNILAFIVAQLEPMERLQVMLKICRHKMPQVPTQNCLQFAQTLVIKHIDRHLKYWKLYGVHRTYLLQLNEFRNIKLDIQRNLSL